MEQVKMDRISELTRISRERELTAAEQEERDTLRKAYIDEWKRDTAATLDNTYVIGPDGVKRKLQKKK